MKMIVAVLMVGCVGCGDDARFTAKPDHWQQNSDAEWAYSIGSHQTCAQILRFAKSHYPAPFDHDDSYFILEDGVVIEETDSGLGWAKIFAENFSHTCRQQRLEQP